jgi:4-amino-4-deoxy-L-arabinose transferase-like glycosyltransferase
MSHSETKNNGNWGWIERLLWCLLILGNALKIFLLAVVLPNFQNFLEYDTINYYLPAAENFMNTYFLTPNELTNIDAQVTPVFPLFLSLPFSNHILLIFNLLISFTTLLLFYKLTAHLFNPKIALVATVLLTWESSFFSSSLRLAPEMLFIFFLISAAYLFSIKPITNNFFNYFGVGMLIGMALLTRPIGLILLAIPTLYFFLNLKRINLQKNTLIWLFASTILPLIWCVRNYKIYKFFGISSISNNNLLFYEGAAAKAKSTGQSLESVQNSELARRLDYLGNVPDTAEINSYNFSRGIKLIQENPMSLIQTHLEGLGKLLFGPGREFNSEVLRNLPDIFLNFQNPILILSLIFLLGLYVSGALGIEALRSNDRVILLTLLAILIPLIAVSSGSIAYSRFRTPLSPIICLLSAVGISHMGNYLQTLRSYRLKK